MMTKRLLACVLALTACAQVHAACVFQAATAKFAGIVDQTVTWPTHQSGDNAFLVISTSGGSPAALGTPSGFTEAANSPIETNSDNNGTGSRLTVYWNRATSSSMAAPVVTFSTDYIAAWIVTFRGCDNAGDPYSQTATSFNLTSSTSVSSPGLTTSGDEHLVCAFIARHNDSSSTTFFDSWANADLTGGAEILDDGATSGGGGGIGAWCGTDTTAGSVTDTTATTALSAVRASMTIDMAPADVTGALLLRRRQ